MIFSNNKYTKYYYLIIDQAKSRVNEPSIVTQSHHIIPESFFKIRTRKGPIGWLDGNAEDDSNKVELTPREHLVCHLLLTRMTVNKAKAKMIRAAYLMTTVMNSDKKSHKVNSRTYEIICRENSKIQKTNHLVGGELQRAWVATGNHHLSDGSIQRKSSLERSKAGLLPAQVESKEGRHRWQGGKIQKQLAKEGRLATQIQCCCLVCREQTNISALSRRHGKNCGKNAVIVNGFKYLTKAKACKSLGITLYELNKILKNE
jgi:hypothetical protein